MPQEIEKVGRGVWSPIDILSPIDLKHKNTAPPFRLLRSPVRPTVGAHTPLRTPTARAK